MFLDQVIHFGKNLGDQVKDRSPKKVKLLIEVTQKVQVLIFNMNLFSLLRSVFLDRVIHVGKNLGDRGKCYSPKKQKSLIEVTKVAHLKLQVVSFNMNIIFSP